MMFGGGEARVEEDFSFRISNLPGGLYRFSVRLPPGNHYVESIRAEGQDIIDRLVEMSDHDHLSGVEVRVSPEGSRISGMVESEEDGKPVDGATVLVFAADPQHREAFRALPERLKPTRPEGFFCRAWPLRNTWCALWSNMSPAVRVSWST